jgi:hypothetical protein
MTAKAEGAPGVRREEGQTEGGVYTWLVGQVNECEMNHRGSNALAE